LQDFQIGVSCGSVRSGGAVGNVTSAGKGLPVDVIGSGGDGHELWCATGECTVKLCGRVGPADVLLSDQVAGGGAAAGQVGEWEIKAACHTGGIAKR